MRLPVDHSPARLAGVGLILTLAGSLAACGATKGGDELALAPVAAPAGAVNGPQADYPVVLGAPFTIGTTTYTPEDILNYDQVGFVAVDGGGDTSISGAHHTLPLPSYVEVTSLETGRTILVRLERRGPMQGNQLVALSQGALAQLGARSGTPVRVRRVNPPEDQRALLRAGQAAPLRMDTPMSLVEVLKRKLPAGAAAQPVAVAAAAPAAAAMPAPSAPPAPAAPRTSAVAASPAPAKAPVQAATASLALPPLATVRTPAEVPTAAATRPARPAPASVQAAAQPARSAPVTDGFVVQAGAFSDAAKARKVAGAIGGEVSKAGSVWRVRTGPFATRNAAEASLAKVRAAGYSEARIFTSG